MQFSFERLELEREDVQADLMGLGLGLSPFKIAEVGCGWGYTTLSLMLELQTSECIGVDQFVKNYLLDVPSIEDVNLQFDEIKNEVLSNAYTSEDDSIKGEIHHIFHKGCFPEFQVGDVVTGDNLPLNLDFIYCKKLLQNIFDGGYGNHYKGDEGVNLAINHISRTVKQGGLICIVEPAGTNFMPFLEQAGLEMIRCCRIQRSRIDGQKRDTIIKEQYFLYHYKKL
jgi:hypothetical protein